MATLARDLPTVDDFAVWNEPNLNGFWLYQFDAAGKDIAAPAYTSLLARTYDALKAVSPKIRVYGGNLAPRGFDDPESPRPTHSPTAFIRDMGTAYRASGRTKPIMDVFALHPYQTRSAIPPGRRTRARRSESPTTTSSSRSSARPSTAPRSPARSSRSPTPSSASSRRSPERAGPYTNLDSPLGQDAVDREDAGRVLPSRRSSSPPASRR